MVRRRADPPANAFRSAPAEKNFSDALATTTARTSSSTRASSTAVANARRKS
jgi:hypothetical protein